MTPPPEGGPGVHAELAVRPDCPVAAVASEVSLREFVPATGSGPPRLVVERPPDPSGGSDRGEPAEVDDRLQPIARTDESVVCRVSEDAECGHERCPACDPGGLPLDPLEVDGEDGELRLHVAAEDGDGVRRCVDAIAEEFDVTPVRLSTVGGSTGGSHRRAVLDLDRLTERQRELARAAAERGYFDPDGPTAEAVAEELDITKSTLSEHLRAVQRELFDQLF
jgi:DNA-binding CsgD family transcriptional regulator